MSSSSIYQQLFDLERTQHIRDAVSIQFPFLLHHTSRRRFESIRLGGLQPSLIRVATEVDLHFLATRFDGTVPPVTCLANPKKPVAHSQEGPVIALAIRTADVQRLYLDWTFGSVWNLANILVSDGECSTPEGVMTELLERGRSIVILEVVPPALLRVRATHSAADRADSWPFLLDVDLNDVWSN